MYNVFYFSYSFLVILMTQFVNAAGQSDSIPVIANIHFDLIEDQIIIRYDLHETDGKNKFLIELEVLNATNEKYEAHSVSGDVNRIVESGNKKTIIWNIKNDYPEFNDIIHVNILAKQYVEIPLQNKLVLSTLYPGISSFQQSDKKYYLIAGALSYSNMAMSIIYGYKARNSYEAYLQSDLYSQRNDHFNEAQKFRELSKAFLFTSIICWGINYAHVIFKHNHDKNLFYQNNLKIGFNIKQLSGPLLNFSIAYHFSF